MNTRCGLSKLRQMLAWAKEQGDRSTLVGLLERKIAEREVENAQRARLRRLGKVAGAFMASKLADTGEKE